MSRQLVPIKDARPNGVPKSPEALGWIWFWRSYNGVESAQAMIKAGNRLYVDPARFLDWMATSPSISPPDASKRSKAKRETAEAIAKPGAAA